MTVTSVAALAALPCPGVSGEGKRGGRYLAGVSTRRVDKLVQQLGVERMSKSQVSRLAKSLDAIVEDFRTRRSRES